MSPILLHSHQTQRRGLISTLKLWQGEKKQRRDSRPLAEEEVSPGQRIAQEAGGRCPPCPPSIKRESAGRSRRSPADERTADPVQGLECHFRHAYQRLGGPETKERGGT